MKQKSTPRAIVRPSRDKTLRESIKANRDEANKLAKELQESLAKRERLQAAKAAEKPKKKLPKSKATVSSSSSSSRSVGTSRSSSPGSAELTIDMSPALTIPLTPDGTKNRHRSDRVERDASDNLQ